MNPALRVLIAAIVAFSLYHLVRDILQIAGVNIWLTDVLHFPHVWCGAYCDYASIPFEVFAFIGGAWVLYRKRLGAMGIAVLSFPVLLFITTFLLP